MAITRDQAKADLEKVMQQLETVGAGTENDRAAQLVMQILGVLERQLGDPVVIKMLYIDNPEASKLIPLTAYKVAEQYAGGTIDEARARKILQDASKQYGEVFQEMGIKPQGSVALFGRR